MGMVLKTGRRGFTLVELIVVIVVLAILAGIAIPRYVDYSARAKEAAARGTLGAVRSAIGNFFQQQMVAGSARYPTLAELQAVGTVMAENISGNPYAPAKLTIRAAVYNGANPPVDNSASDGYCYDATAGRFWLNSDTLGSAGTGENSW